MFNFFNKPKQPISLCIETDMHLHIVPGVDDGCPDVATSVEVLGRLNEMGIKRVICSPHVTSNTFENNRETLQPAFDSLVEAAKDAGLGDIPLRYGAENRIDDLFQKNFREGTLITHPGKFILIENPFVQEPWDLDTLIFDLRVRGFQPILAHPERFAYYHARPKRYEELHPNVPFQINVLSLAGYYGRQIRKMAEDLIDAGMVDYLGTDAHGVRHTDCIAEYLRSSEARRHAKHLAGHLLNEQLPL